MRQRAPHHRPLAALLEHLEPRVLLSAAVDKGGRGRPRPVLKPALPRASTGVVVAAAATPATSPPGAALTPTQILHAYGFDQIPFALANGGAGQTIAIIDAYHSPTVLQDLQAFDAFYGIADPPSFTRVAQDGSQNFPSTDPVGPGVSSWELETALDVEWAHVIAPAANILLVEANDSSLSNLISGAVGFARSQPGVSVVSMSFGGGEFAAETNFDPTFTTPSGHTPITFLAATGDHGSPPTYPATSPNVVAIGGTTLSVDSSGNYLGESAWSGSAGGANTKETQPNYQIGLTSAVSVGFRTVPDVSIDANPNTGVAVYDSYDFPGNPWIQIGGTSLSTPLWAGLIAIANQGRVLQGEATLDSRADTLPLLYALPAADFNDIASGTTTGTPQFSATPGYDLTTGRGTPIVNKVVYGLMNVTGSISGTVFQDNNSDGVENGADAALPAGTTVYLDTNHNGTFNTGTSATASSTPNVSIPDNNFNGVTDSVSISGLTGTISNIHVTFNITHQRDADLTVLLIAPDGSQLALVENRTGTNFTNTSFSDQALTFINSGSGSYTGTFRPAQAFDNWNGHSPNGTWTLKVFDNVRDHTSGTLNSWSLTVTAGANDPYTTTTDASGNYSFTGVPLGTNYPVRIVPPANMIQTFANNASLFATALTNFNISAFPTLFTAMGATDSFYLAMDPTDTDLEISTGTTGLSPATYRIARANLPALTFNLQGNNSVLVVDFVNGSPIPAGNITLNTLASTQQELRLNGSDPSQAFTIDSGAISLVGGGSILYSANLPILTVANLTITNTGDLTLNSLNINAGATFNF